MSRILGLVVVCAALALSPPAFAAGKQFWHGPYDKIGQDISGIPDMQVDLEDDPAEWGSIESALGIPAGESLLGFVSLSAPAGSFPYHQIFVAPQVTVALAGAIPIDPNAPISMIWDRVSSGSVSYGDAAIAILTVIHEAYHYRLMSGDEARVNACALRDMPSYLESEFHVPQVLTTTVQVPETRTVSKRVPYTVTLVEHKRVKGRLVTIRKKVRRYRTTTATETVMVPQTQTQPNPAYDGIIAAANAFRATQPPPYNTGDCF